MYKNINKKGFTLIELIVGISIILILIMSGRNMSFKNISDKQRLEIFNNKIISEIEKVRNESLIGKGIGVDLNTPKIWKIDFSRNSGGKIIVSYTIDGTTWIELNNITLDNLISINQISCINHNETSIQNLSTTQTGSILFEKGKYKLGGNCNNTFTNLKVKLHNKGYFKEFNFDTISGIIKR